MDWYTVFDRGVTESHSLVSTIDQILFLSELHPSSFISKDGPILPLQTIPTGIFPARVYAQLSMLLLKMENTLESIQKFIYVSHVKYALFIYSSLM